LLIPLLTALAAAWGYLDLRAYSRTASDLHGSDQTVLILPGEEFAGVLQKLNQSQVIRSPLRFELLARIKGLDKQLKAGEYHLSSAMTPRQVLDTLVSGRVTLHRLTIPEGYQLKQIAQAVETAGFCDAETFLQTASDATLIAQWGIEADSLEGYLFPDTYLLPATVSPQDIISVMVERFHQVYCPQWQQRAAQLGYTTHQIITLASIIEKETGDPAERPLIASVFHNRLKRGMRLDSDPTVIYGIKDFDGNLKRIHLRTPTAYNTYIISGLPPGPIASPGKSAIKAALYPADTKYLYFVSKKDKTHYFSATIAEHNRAVRKYQLRRRRQ
jgi:UPF0755 protein